MSDPLAGLSPELREVVLCAMECAIAPPLGPHAHTSAARIPWPRVLALRSALEAAGLPWREAKRIDDERLAARRRELAQADARAELLARGRGAG